MWSATWPQHDKSGVTGWTGHCSLLHNPFQATSKPPISQVTKKSFWQCLSFAPLFFLLTCPSEAVSLSSLSHSMYRGFFALLFQPPRTSVSVQTREVALRLPNILICLQIPKSTPWLLLPHFFSAYSLLFWGVTPCSPSLFLTVTIKRPDDPAPCREIQLTTGSECLSRLMLLYTSYSNKITES